MLDPRLRHVVAVAREGSFTAAAAAVGVSQPAVTKSIADLEREVGYAIFYRTAGGAVPTEEGRTFIERTIRVLDDVRELLRTPLKYSDPYAGTLRIGVCPAPLEWQLVETLDALLHQHPSIRLDVSGGSFERVVHQLHNNAIDIAVGFDEAFAGWPELARKPIGALQSTLFVRKAHPLLQRQVSLDALAEFDFLSPSESKPYGDAIRKIYDHVGVSWQKKVHVMDYFPATARLVKHSDAIAMVNRAYARSESFLRSFATLEHPDFFPPSPLCCAFRARREPTPASRAFIATICTVNSRRT